MWELMATKKGIVIKTDFIGVAVGVGREGDTLKWPPGWLGSAQLVIWNYKVKVLLVTWNMENEVCIQSEFTQPVVRQLRGWCLGVLKRQREDACPLRKWRVLGPW